MAGETGVNRGCLSPESESKQTPASTFPLLDRSQAPSTSPQYFYTRQSKSTHYLNHSSSTTTGKIISKDDCWPHIPRDAINLLFTPTAIPMSKVKAKYSHSGLAGLIESDSEDTQFVEAMPTPDSAAENKGPAKKGRGRPKAVPTKVTKAKAPARRTSGRLDTKATIEDTIPAKGRRQALTDKTNQQYASETEEVDDFDEDVLMEDAPVKQAKGKATKKAATTRKNDAKEILATNYSIDDTTPAAPRLSKPTKKRGPAKKDIPEELSPERVIAETQGPVMVEEEVDEIVSKSAHNVARPRSHSRHRQPSVQRRRAGSASDTERNDPALRRKLGEVTKKYENLHLKYQDLREIGLKESERNFERLKKSSEEKTRSWFPFLT